MDEIEEKLAIAMAAFSVLSPEEKEKVEEYMKFMLYFKEMTDHMNVLTQDHVEESETFATINKHLRAIIRELKKMEE